MPAYDCALPGQGTFIEKTKRSLPSLMPHSRAAWPAATGWYDRFSRPPYTRVFWLGAWFAAVLWTHVPVPPAQVPDRNQLVPSLATPSMCQMGEVKASSACTFPSADS